MNFFPTELAGRLICHLKRRKNSLHVPCGAELEAEKDGVSPGVMLPSEGTISQAREPGAWTARQQEGRNAEGSVQTQCSSQTQQGSHTAATLFQPEILRSCQQVKLPCLPNSKHIITCSIRIFLTR